MMASKGRVARINARANLAVAYRRTCWHRASAENTKIVARRGVRAFEAPMPPATLRKECLLDRSAVERAASLAGLELDPETDVTITGADPVLASPLRLGEGAATALALVGQEADRIWQARGGKRQAMQVGVAHAAASLHSFAFLRVEGAGNDTPLRRVPPITAVFKCGDGRYIHLHGSFGDAPGILAELGLPEDATAEEIANATDRRGAFELEDALAAKHLCGAVCRTQEEWLSHTQGRLLAGKPVVELTRIGEAPSMPFPEGDRPLSGIRVLDLTRVLAGPTCARTLAEHGADVLHIASPRLPTIPLFEMDTGHGKRQAHIDLDEPEGAETLRELVRGADVFSQGFRHGALEKRGLGAEDLARLRPGIIYVSEDAYGHDGPWRYRPGWEQLAQATTGVTVIQGDERPAITPAAMNDYTTGYLGALGVMMALRRRAVEGGSWLVRVSLSQTSMWFLRLGHDLDRAEASGHGDVTSLMEQCDTPYGRMNRMRPAQRMSETPPHWSITSQPLGSGLPSWT
jgi:crotonobetainyl-CoA:carnitine CoA-transferase CaiB-like acyl-CoA transferase